MDWKEKLKELDIVEVGDLISYQPYPNRKRYTVVTTIQYEAYYGCFYMSIEDAKANIQEGGAISMRKYKDYEGKIEIKGYKK